MSKLKHEEAVLLFAWLIPLGGVSLINQVVTYLLPQNYLPLSLANYSLFLVIINLVLYCFGIWFGFKIFKHGKQHTMALIAVGLNTLALLSLGIGQIFSVLNEANPFY